jgi:hypothetical protein
MADQKSALEPGQSAFLAFLEPLRERSKWPYTAPSRTLTSEEIQQLEKQGNGAADWNQVRVAPTFNPKKVVGCYFRGQNYLGEFKDSVSVPPGIPMGSGVYNSDVQNCFIGDHALVLNNTLVANTVIDTGAAVVGCGIVSGPGEGKTSTFANGTILHLGMETDGRNRAVYAEITLKEAALLDSTALVLQGEKINAYATRCASAFSFVGQGAQMLNTPRVQNVALMPHAVIDSAQWVEEVTLLSSKDEPASIAGGSVVKNALIQQGAGVDTQAVVENAVLCEHSHVEIQGKLLNSLLGPNSGVAEGECSYSLVGPFVGFHHQALLIASFWPEGKGNIGHGANIGSNHTGKAPDQECWPGEGTFFGLGVNIKYPSNFANAPFSVIASGITTLPQKIEMPFSLVAAPSEVIPGLSPAINEIFPGWVLAENFYAVKRNETKFAKRNKARRQQLDTGVLRPEILELMHAASKTLKEASEKTWYKDAAGHPVYTEREIPGLGKNYLKAAGLQSALSIYQFYRRYCALLGFHRKLLAAQSKDRPLRDTAAELLAKPGEDYLLGVLRQEFKNYSPEQLWAETVNVAKKVAEDCKAAKARDDKRGQRIISDYKTTHPAPEDDPVIKAVVEEARAIQEQVRKWTLGA